MSETPEDDDVGGRDAVEAVDTASMCVAKEENEALALVSSDKVKESMFAVCDGNISRTPEFVSHLVDYLFLELPSPSDSRAFIQHLSVRAMDVLSALMEHAERTKELESTGRQQLKESTQYAKDAAEEPTDDGERGFAASAMHRVVDKMKFMLLGGALQWSISWPLALGALLYELCNVTVSTIAAGWVILTLAFTRLWYFLFVTVSMFSGQRLAERADDTLGAAAGALALALHFVTMRG